MNEITTLDHDPARKSHIGTRPIRSNGLPKLTDARYGIDYVMPGVTWCKNLRSPRIRSSDTSKAEPLLRGYAAVTGTDFRTVLGIG